MDIFTVLFLRAICIKSPSPVYWKFNCHKSVNIMSDQCIILYLDVCLVLRIAIAMKLTWSENLLLVNSTARIDPMNTVESELLTSSSIHSSLGGLNVLTNQCLLALVQRCINVALTLF